jgi:hypothetical protein
MGRFVQRDPIGLEGGDINEYGYCGNEVIMFVDVDGLELERICLPAYNNTCGWVNVHVVGDEEMGLLTGGDGKDYEGVYFRNRKFLDGEHPDIYVNGDAVIRAVKDKIPARGKYREQMLKQLIAKRMLSVKRHETTHAWDPETNKCKREFNAFIGGGDSPQKAKENVRRYSGCQNFRR